MQPQSKIVQPGRNVYKIALLIALACVLQISESIIPHPVPGLRLGLANMVTLTAMVVLGFGCALEVAILRTVISSFFIGTFMSPTFLLSLGGAVVSTLVMGFFYWLSGLSRYCRLSIIGISIVGAFVHNLVQLCLAYLLLVKHAGIFVFFPWLSIGAVATGWVVGVVTGGVCRRLLANDPEVRMTEINVSGGNMQARCFLPGESRLHRLPAEVKLIGLFLLALSALIVTHGGFYLCFFLFLCVLLPAAQTPFLFFVGAGRKYLTLIIISFMLPLCFNSGTHVLVNLGVVEITREGLHLGVLFAARILLLVLSSALLMRTTSPASLASGLGRLLWPVRFFGISPQRIATLLSLSWEAVPYIWNTARAEVVSLEIRKIKTISGLLPKLSDLIVSLYLKTEPAQNSWNRSSRTMKRGSKTLMCRHEHE